VPVYAKWQGAHWVLSALVDLGYPAGDVALAPMRDRVVKAEARYYRQSTEVKLGNDDVDWGGTSTRRMNPWVTVEALAVLRAAGTI
jgi:hypothetical protein